ncbi:unnamed protein product [Blepharisma stoltei]|uniref:Vesicle transport protein GOT1A n=1 Tax=Blepharisma stoltei TaxID=1481888 RepID=A0AAU9JH11_9CILI|nr:unnamed protein product [Blepharisma stoltei]
MYLSNSKKSGGSILTLAGLFCYLLGLIFVFDRFFLIIGNLLFTGGTCYIAGTATLLSFFFKPSKLKGSACYFIGFFLIICNWTILGTFIQLFGFFYLFRDFVPQLYSSSKYIPGVGSYICNSPFIHELVGKISGQGKATSV